VKRNVGRAKLKLQDAEASRGDVVSRRHVAPKLRSFVDFFAKRFGGEKKPSRSS